MKKRRPDSSPATGLVGEEAPLTAVGISPNRDKHSTAVPPTRQQIFSRCKPTLAYIVYAVFTVGPLIERGYVPSILLRLASVTGIGYLLYRVLTFRRWGDEHKQVIKFLVCFLLMIVELLWENFMVWIVSVTDLRKYEDVPALQDNVEIVVNAAAAHSPLLHAAVYARWANILHFLGSILALAFGSLWDQTPYSGFGMMARFALTIAVGRVIRVGSFMSTVLPSPRPGCYRERFPVPAPDTWRDIVVQGVTTLRGFGGCNDLVFSGHGAFWTLAPLMFQEYYPGRVSWFLWLALLQTSVRDVLEKQHYAVDMLLAPVVTAAVWRWLEWVYPPSQPLPKRPPGAAADAVNPFVVGLIVFALVVAGIIVIGGKA